MIKGRIARVELVLEKWHKQFMALDSKDPQETIKMKTLMDCMSDISCAIDTTERDRNNL